MDRRLGFRYLLCISTCAALLAGCEAQRGFDSAGRAMLPAANRSWMTPGAEKSTSLLYISNIGTASVTAYTYVDGGSLILVGQLTGFTSPAGMCADKAGDVWITDSGTDTVYEYQHGGTTPIATIHEA